MELDRTKSIVSLSLIAGATAFWLLVATWITLAEMV